MRRFLVLCFVLSGFGGCHWCDREHGVFFHHRHRDTDTLCREHVPTCNQPILEAARAVTEFEDGLRRDGTITIKTPDVWGDSNLMHSIQEFDKELRGTIGEFKETLQATVSLTDAAGVATQTEVTVGIDGATPGDSPGSNLSLPVLPSAFDSLKLLEAAAASEGKLNLEPTERERQHATYVSLNQALRRRSMGGDNTRKAGYGLYLFRIPVSILPGEETSQGYSAVANIRARMVTTKADVKYTLPRMAIADLVEALAEGIVTSWNNPYGVLQVAEGIAVFRKELKAIAANEPDTNLDEVKKAVHELAKNHKDMSEADIYDKIDDINCRFALAMEKNHLVKHVRYLKKLGALGEKDAFRILEKLENSQVDKVKCEEQLEWVKSKIADAKDYAEAAHYLAKFVDEKNSETIDYSTFDSGYKEILESRHLEPLSEIRKKLLSDKGRKFLSNTKKWHDFKQDKMAKISPLVAAVTTPVIAAPEFAASSQAKATGLAQLSVASYGTEDFDAIRKLLKSRSNGRLGSSPQQQEVRQLLFDLLEQINIRLQAMKAYDLVAKRGVNAIQLAATEIELNRSTDSIGADWRRQLTGLSGDSDPAYLRSAWLLARQCGLVDLNIKRMMQEMQLRGDLSAEEVCEAQTINFFSDYDLPAAQMIWQRIVEQEFPLQVFTLEPLVEEQNLLDASSRLREMQIALAVSVAQGAWNAGQRVELARQLARESAAIGLNRTVVGFAHGMDTFGWYFNPRIQSPETEVRNGRAFGRILKSTGPTPKDEARTYRLEPGIRECEVIVAMPSFISQVEFDVTTNWESLANPGRSKRSYEELIQEGCKLQKMMACIDSAVCDPECRVGDLARLQSRAQQLGNMLGMQTHRVTVPFEHDQPATELFEQGDKELVPTVSGFYGLSTLIAKDGNHEFTADFFITGRNFHPTLTHVIVAGHESHSDETDASKVEILSRELLRVQTKLNTDRFAGENGFEVRVGTPGGLSNPLSIPKVTVKKEDRLLSPFDWELKPKFTVSVAKAKGKPKEVDISVVADNLETEFRIKSSQDNLLQITQLPDAQRTEYRNADLKFPNNDKGFELRIVYKATFNDKNTRTVYGKPVLFKYEKPISRRDLLKLIKHDLEVDSDPQVGLRPTDQNKGQITGTTYLRLDNWPLIKLDTPIEIELK